MKRILSILLTLVLILSIGPTASGATSEANEAAEALYELGLFQGTGMDASGNPIYELDRAPTRHEAITMLVRLLGKENEAKAGTWSTPFKDVEEWAKPYVGYAYTNGLTNGTGATTFSGQVSVTATEYITFVLRALGYSATNDFKWSSAWDLSDEIGLTNGEYNSENNISFTRGDTATISNKALDVHILGSNKPLRDIIVLATPPDMNTRLLTDSQIAALEGKTASELRTAISSVADAKAYLNQRFPTLWHSYHMWKGAESNTFILRSGEEILAPNTGKPAGRSDIITAMSYLLSDNNNICSLYGFRHFEDGIMAPVMAVNYIKSGDSYTIFDPVLGMAADKSSRYGPLLPEAAVSSLKEYVDIITSDGQLYLTVDSLYPVSYGRQITGIDKNKWVTITSPSIQPLYANEEKNLTDEEYEEKMYGHIKPENINQYQLASLLGGVTLTVDEAKALVNAEPGVVKDSIKTAGDMLMYMLAARILECKDRIMNISGYNWHYNLNAKQVMEQHVANCGSSANLANYLLEGDYDEVGIILQAYYPGNGGGHVYNYFKYEGQYYIVDFSWYIFGNYSISNDFPVMKLYSLEEYGAKVSQLYSGVSLVIAHTSTGQHLPSIFGEEYGNNNYYIPEGAEYKLLYQSNDATGYKLATKPLNSSMLDWNKFW